MKIRVLFMQRAESYPGEHAPEALEIIDEFALEECDAAYWPRIKREAIKRIGNEVAGFADVTIEVPTDEIRRLCLPEAKTIKGKVTCVEKQEPVVLDEEST